MTSISKELERILEDYAPIVKEGHQVLIGLLDGTIHLEKGQKEKHLYKFVFLLWMND